MSVCVYMFLCVCKYFIIMRNNFEIKPANICIEFPLEIQNNLL